MSFPTPSPNTVIKTGWIVKEGHKVANLKERFFVLRVEDNYTPKLYYYESENPGSECKGQCDLSGASVSKTKKPRGIYENCLRLDMSKEKPAGGFMKLVICFKSADELSSWKAAFSHSMNAKNIHQQHMAEQSALQQTVAKEEEDVKNAQAELNKEAMEAKEAEAIAQKERAEADAAEAARQKEEAEAQEARLAYEKEQAEAEEAAERAEIERLEAEEAEEAARVAAANVEELEEAVARLKIEVSQRQDDLANTDNKKTRAALNASHNKLELAEKRLAEAKTEAAEAEAIAEREREEAEAAEREREREEREAAEAEQVLRKEQAEADEAARVAEKERLEAEEAERRAAKEKQDVIEAEARLAKEKQEAEAAKAKANQAKEGLKRQLSAQDVDSAEEQAKYSQFVQRGGELRKFARANLVKKKVKSMPPLKHFKMVNNQIQWEQHSPKGVQRVSKGPSTLLKNAGIGELDQSILDGLFHIQISGNAEVDVIDVCATTSQERDMWVRGIEIAASKK